MAAAKALFSLLTPKPTLRKRESTNPTSYCLGMYQVTNNSIVEKNGNPTILSAGDCCSFYSAVTTYLQCVIIYIHSHQVRKIHDTPLAFFGAPACRLLLTGHTGRSQYGVSSPTQTYVSHARKNSISTPVPIYKACTYDRRQSIHT